jgi:hypothetical protein
MSPEQHFARILDHLRAQGHKNLQGALQGLDPSELSEDLRRWLSFWQSLSGPCRNLMFDQACGRRLNKTYPTTKPSMPMRRSI